MTEKLKEYAQDIFLAGVNAVRGEEVVRRAMSREGERILIRGRSLDLSRYERILVVGAGKATAAMARALEEIIGGRIEKGLISVKYEHGLPLRKIKVREAGHPIPDEAGVENAREIFQILQEAGERDLVFCLLSGGGSALIPAPALGIGLEAKQEITRQLLAAGAPIEEVNTVRKHLSRLKGGGMARAAAPARLISLILSDVVGDDLGTIASGPTAPDSTTFFDCREVLERYSLWARVPKVVRKRIESGINGAVPDNPKPQDPIFDRVENLIVGSNLLALEAARERAEGLGFKTLIISSEVVGEVGDFAREADQVIKEMRREEKRPQLPACLLWGGETTVKLEGSGLGGRNQELALNMALRIVGEKEMVFLAGGTDGTDGPTDAAGAVVDGETAARAWEEGIDPRAFLDDNDTYNFFSLRGGHIITGPTGTNVMDIYLALLAGGG